MLIFLAEFVTGGGLWSWGVDASATDSLVVEGEAMVRAVARDLAQIPGVELVVARDVRWSGSGFEPARLDWIENAAAERACYARWAARGAQALVLAPELRGALTERIAWCDADGMSMISAGREFAALASDKWACHERLAAGGVPRPRTWRWAAGQSFPDDLLFPLVVKPNDGAGSLGVCRARNSVELSNVFAAASDDLSPAWVFEEQIAGRAVSVAALCGPAGATLLPACEQRLGGASGFEYQGGRGPLAPNAQRRAERLARTALAALPPARGYVGFDLVLGEGDAGERDAVIEVNPRLTTSYVGLRRLVEGNLAEAMLRAALGRSPDVRIRDVEVEFESAGRVVVHRSD